MVRDLIRETILVMELTLRLLLKGKQMMILFFGSLLLFAVMLLGMDGVKEEKTKQYIGMVAPADCAAVQEIVSGMQQKDLYEVILGEQEELLQQLKKGELSAVCVFPENFTESVAKGETDRLVTIFERKGAEAPLLEDILAGVMMQEICTAKSYQTLLDYEQRTEKETVLSEEEYKIFTDSLLEEWESGFSFDITYVADDGSEAVKPSREMIYEQAVFAVFALMTGFVSLYAVLPFRQMIHGRQAEKIRTVPLHKAAIYAGNALAGVILPLILGVLFLVGLILQNPERISKILSLLVCTTVYVCVIVCIMLITACGIKNPAVYRMGMLAMILIFGVFGLVSLVEGLLIPEGIAVWVPNGWYVQKMTDLYY